MTNPFQRDMRLVIVPAHTGTTKPDEVRWSRLAQPNLHTWTGPHQELRLVAKQRAPDDRDPQALACYGVVLRGLLDLADQMWVRFASGQPVSELTTQFLAWCCTKLAAAGVRAWVLIWDNASGHTSKQVRSWLRAHNRTVKHAGHGVRMVPGYLPTKSPWLNPIEPKWIHGKRAVLEPERVLTTDELEARVYAYYRCTPDSHLVIPDKAA
ncbi:MAG: transposase [Chloroflexota bacterium]|nr:transposase [Chloroflexota bacterium]